MQHVKDLNNLIITFASPWFLIRISCCKRYSQISFFQAMSPSLSIGPSYRLGKNGTDLVGAAAMHVFVAGRHEVQLRTTDLTRTTYTRPMHHHPHKYQP
jgi:hypothetical protein